MLRFAAAALACLAFRPQDSEPQRTVPDAAGSADAPVLFAIGVHIEPFGAVPSGLAGDVPTPPKREGRQPDYNEPMFFRKHVQDLKTLISIIERHGGKATVQAQTPFTRAAADAKETLFGELEKNGHEVALHFHEDAHLGKESERQPAETWSAVMKEEMAWLRKAGATKIRYWSGGNLYANLLGAASAAGLDVMGDYKNPKLQKSDERLLGVVPWRPSAGPTDLERFAKHDASGKVVYLPSGLFDRVDYAGSRRSKEMGGDAKYFDFMTESLEKSLRAARRDRVNVFHVTVHAGEFRGQDRRRPFGVIEDWLAKAIDPLVTSGRVRWATFSEMADAYLRWEKENAGVDPRATGMVPRGESTLVSQDPVQGMMTFAINVHDWRYVESSADALLRAVAIFEKHKVRGDFYLTAPMVEIYAERRPDVIRRLRESGMTISYHVRPPHPLWKGFDDVLAGLDDEALEATLRDYETYRLDLSTGGLDKSKPGGYALVKELLGRAPVVVGAASAEPRVKRIAYKIYREMGAKCAVLYHESGTKMDRPLEYSEGLLVRPSDFSVTRWKEGGEREDAFWWNRKGPDPLSKLKEQLAAWKGPRAPFVTALIHENNFYRFGPEGWTFVYYEDKKKNAAKKPPFDLNAKDRSRERSKEEQEGIWAAYDAMIAYAAANLRVVTSEDIVEMARGK